MRNVRLQLSYDGSRYFGWQRQDGFVTVQEVVEDAFEGLIGHRATVYGAGRTDTGVHALRQVANAHVETRLGDDRLRHALNAHLPGDVVVRRLETCDDDFHARFDAVSKRYGYLVSTARFRPALGDGLSHWTSSKLDLGAMRAAARDLVGRHDFRAFGNAGSPRSSTVRTLTSVRIVARRRHVAFLVQGEGFLYKMVRTIAGTLLDVGRGRLAMDVVRRGLETGRREDVGPTAPARGLFLLAVRYPGLVFGGADRGPAGVPGVFQ